ncbi:hypothetical protein ELP67_06710 [Bacillus safensis]|nr:hypothetical protein ELP67_06710 [Bacillus safensis]
MSQRVDKPSHSLSGLRSGAHECRIRSAPVLALPRLQRFSITLNRRQRAKIKTILALCQQFATPAYEQVSFFNILSFYRMLPMLQMAQGFFEVSACKMVYFLIRILC